MTVISKYLPQLNANCLRAMNNVYKCLGVKPRKDLQLLQRSGGTDVVEFSKLHDIILPQTASEYTYVRLGKKSDLSYKNEIFTFFDEQGRILRRYFRLDGLNQEQYNYQYVGKKRIVERSRFSPSKMIDDETNCSGKWEKETTETQIIYKFVKNLVRQGKEATLLLSRKVNHITNDGKVEHVTFTRYPINLGFEENTKKQVVSGIITNSGNDIELSELAQTSNVNLDLRDEFLKYRFIDPRSDLAMNSMTMHFLKDKNLDDFGLRIIPSARRVPKNSLGYFSEFDQEICYSSKIKDGNVVGAVKTAAHEVEHAYQHSLIGRIGRSRSRYGSISMCKLGYPSREESSKAVAYAMARDIYPLVSDTEDLNKNVKYMTNLLEVDARKAGEDAAQKYMYYRTNFEFFDQFYE